jgi:hypothetical protein
MSMTQPMDNRGGYRKPTNPAVVSGPGALSQRTDGSPSQPATYISGLPYGEGQATYDQQTAAPMAGVEQMPMPELPPIVPLSEPTQFPNEPISYGASWGEGPGPNLGVIPSIGNQVNPLNVIYRMMPYDTSGALEAVYNRLNEA